MMHNKSLNTVLIIATIVGIAFAAPKPDESDLKKKIGHSGGLITRNGDTVSASWGGFQAFASLADDGSAVVSAGGNGLGSGAGYGIGGAGHGAGAGAGIGAGTGYAAGAGAGAGYGAGAGAGAGVFGAGTPSGKPFAEIYGHGGKPGSADGSPLYHHGAPGNDFYNRIFAIPINVLQSVNTYLNQKQIQGHKGAVFHSHTATHNNGAVATASASASSAVL